MQRDIENVPNDAVSKRMMLTENEILMRLDVDKALRALPPRLLLICRMLARGEPKTVIAEKVGKSHTTIQNDIGKIRRIFQQRNLQIYIND